ncbi:hypothetical protein ACQEVB_01835 [Pseudonocardia sp. CA-107938]|uniref:hypothetical protein n=1 Tax=Pseudonocardia sp. CA-107938 TaxID=3240021 RepID=UPI003D8BD659
MSRHRSPGGRHRGAGRPVEGHDPVDIATRRTRSAPRHRAASAVQHGMGAAAAGGVLAAIAPTMLVGTAIGGDAADASTSLALASDDRRDVPLPPIRDELGRRVLASIAPVTAPDVEPEQATVSSLIKAAGLDDAAQKAEEAVHCAVRLPQLGLVKPWAKEAAQFIACLFDEHDVLGIGGRGRVSDHPRGLAVDFMTRGEDGDRIARCVLRNQEELGVSYVIWKQRINYGQGWEPMEDRGSITENHFDHVHVSFEPRPGTGTPDPTVCSG